MSLDKDDVADVVREEKQVNLYNERGRGFTKSFDSFHNSEVTASHHPLYISGV